MTVVARPLPLDGVRILSVEQYGAGPFATMHLADLGAEVIKIESPATGGDVGRYVPPFARGEDSLFFQSLNRNKRSLSLDLQTAAGHEVFRDLVRTADAVFSNLRGDLPERLGLRYADLQDVNPRIVCCSLSGFGMTGPRAAEPAYDYLLQGLAGWMHLTGEPDGPPVKSGLSMVDWSGGLTAALALVVGLHAARRDGIGTDCDLGLFDVAVSMLTYPAAWWLNEGYEVERTRHSAHPSLVPFQNFRTADGWVVVACAKEKFWDRLVEVLGLGARFDGPAYGSFAGRRDASEEVLAALEVCFLTAGTAAWVDRLTAAGIPVAPVNTVSEALAEPQARARGLVLDVPHPERGTVRQTASPVRVGRPRTEHSPAPVRDADAAPLLTELGYGPDQLLRLAGAGAFGPARVPDGATTAPRTDSTGSTHVQR